MQYKTKQNKTKQKTKKQNKTNNKTKQNKNKTKTKITYIWRKIDPFQLSLSQGLLVYLHGLQSCQN